jgi:hypothetical protein
MSLPVHLSAGCPVPTSIGAVCVMLASILLFDLVPDEEDVVSRQGQTVWLLYLAVW